MRSYLRLNRKKTSRIPKHNMKKKWKLNCKIYAEFYFLPIWNNLIFSTIYTRILLKKLNEILGEYLISPLKIMARERGMNFFYQRLSYNAVMGLSPSLVCKGGRRTGGGMLLFTSTRKSIYVYFKLIWSRWNFYIANSDEFVCCKKKKKHFAWQKRVIIINIIYSI